MKTPKRHRFTITFSLFTLFLIGSWLAFAWISGNWQSFHQKIPSAISALIRSIVYIALFVVIDRKVPDPAGTPFYRNPIKLRFLGLLLLFEVLVVHEAIIKLGHFL